MKRLGALPLCFLLGCDVIGSIGGSDEPPHNPSDPNNPRDPNQPSQPSEPVSCEQPKTGRRLLRRLTRSEYDRTIEDLLNIRAEYGVRFAADTSVEGYDNHADALVVAPLLGDQIRLAAEDLSARAVENLSALAPCATGEACAVQVIRDFGERAFRRPLSDEENLRYLRLFRSVGDFSEGLRWVVAAMLQSPNFLYRSEIGSVGVDGIYPLSSWEIATELSYFITGSMPDATLFAAARSGELSEPAAMEREVKRLFQTPGAKEMLSRFAGSWLELDRLAEVPKDSTTYPGFDGAARAAMSTQTHNFLSRVVYEGSGTLGELLTAIDGSPERVGLLSQPSLLAVHARPNSSSPVHRGKLVRERLLCQKLAPPPPGVVIQPPPLDPGLTSRERYAQHTSAGACAGCHRMIDPVGFAFEHFDGIGQYRADENGLPIDDSGEILASRSTDGTFDGVSGLAAVLANSDEVRGCFVEHWFRFAYGLSPDGELACVLRDVKETIGPGDPAVQPLVLALALHPRGRTRAGEVASTTPPEEMPPEEMPPEEMPPVQEISVSVLEDSRWETGHCDQVTVTNNGATMLDWEIALRIEGTITQHWNAQASGTNGEVRFGGVSWNDTIGPGASASFGYCASI
jgi:hypothetical protein